jgi:hypothetical protein
MSNARNIIEIARPCLRRYGSDAAAQDGRIVGRFAYLTAFVGGRYAP